MKLFRNAVLAIVICSFFVGYTFYFMKGMPVRQAIAVQMSANS